MLRRLDAPPVHLVPIDAIPPLIQERLLARNPFLPQPRVLPRADAQQHRIVLSTHPCLPLLGPRRRAREPRIAVGMVLGVSLRGNGVRQARRVGLGVVAREDVGRLRGHVDGLHAPVRGWQRGAGNVRREQLERGRDLGLGGWSHLHEPDVARAEHGVGGGEHLGAQGGKGGEGVGYDLEELLAGLGLGVRLPRGSADIDLVMMTTGQALRTIEAKKMWLF